MGLEKADMKGLLILAVLLQSSVALSTNNAISPKARGAQHLAFMPSRCFKSSVGQGSCGELGSVIMTLLESNCMRANVLLVHLCLRIRRDLHNCYIHAQVDARTTLQQYSPLTVLGMHANRRASSLAFTDPPS